MNFNTITIVPFAIVERFWLIPTPLPAFRHPSICRTVARSLMPFSNADSHA